MNRYWVSWWTGNYASEGCTAPPFQVWVSGERMRAGSDKTDLSMCAVMDAKSERKIWKAVQKYYPDCSIRFCEKQEDDFVPGDRFPGFENRTSLHGAAQ
jgi:hypothetical protein